jgi:glyoxylase-like metal-dependent hydrolase (beta-lactamase superfamily II)
MGEAREAAADAVVLPSYLNLPGFGQLAINSFLLRAAEPVLVDTGLGALEGPFMAALRAQIDPAEIRWIWLTHADPDHTGNLAAVLREAPNARVVTAFLAMGKLALAGRPVDPVDLLEPGGSLDVGDRVLEAVKPPYYDAPETMGFFDPKTRVFYSADCFGALLKKPAPLAEAVDEGELKNGLLSWSAFDSPWLKIVDPERFEAALEGVRGLETSAVLSAHLPPAADMTDRLLGWLREAYVERRAG